ncbi:MAG: MBL fold metallo-hydrolase [Bacteroidota bacterium]
MTEQAVWKLKFYGVRGSTPICDPNFGEFGGDTTCFYLDLLLKKGQEKITVIFDAGTGIRQLGKDIINGIIPPSDKILILFTHFHWDHIQGFPFFSPAYFTDREIFFFSPHHCLDSDEQLKGIFERQMQSEYFPVQLEKMGADFRFYTTEEFQAVLSMDQNVSLKFRRQNHPGGSYGFRLDGYGKSVVVCTDIEHGLDVDPEVVDFCQGADLLVHEAQYTDEELAKHRGWGHSSFNQAVELAKRAAVKHLYLTHHDPDHDDVFLRAQEQLCRAKFSNCTIARQGTEVVV